MDKYHIVTYVQYNYNTHNTRSAIKVHTCTTLELLVTCYIGA